MRETQKKSADSFSQISSPTFFPGASIISRSFQVGSDLERKTDLGSEGVRKTAAILTHLISICSYSVNLLEG